MIVRKGLAALVALLALPACEQCGNSFSSTATKSPDKAASQNQPRDAAAASVAFPKDGRRLKLRSARSAKPPAIGEAYDSDLGFTCALLRGFDKRLRCLPDRKWALAHDETHPIWTADPYYTDDACTALALGLYVRVGEVPRVVDWPPKPRFDVGLRRPERLGKPMRYGILGDPFDPPVLFTNRTPGCYRAEYKRDDRSKVYRVARELSLTDFVAGADPLPIGPAEGRLQTRIVLGEDGSKIPYDYWDTKLQIPCRFGTSGFPADRCIPHWPDVDLSSVHADSECTDTVAMTCRWVGEKVNAGQWSELKPRDERPYQTRPNEFGILGKVVKGTPGYLWVADSCQRFPTGPSEYKECEFRAIERRLSVEEFASR